MSLPKEPRQLMINLMYLVLTAMLALNVSSEILHAFKTINQSIGSSNSSIQERNVKMYAAFDAQESEPGQKERVKPFNDRAKIARTEAQQMYDYLQSWKERIITASGGYEGKNNKEIKAESDIDASTRLLVENNGGDTIKNRIIELRNKLLTLVNPQDPTTFAHQMPLNIIDASKTDNNPQGDWKIGNFYNMPVMAAVTLFSKFQNDVRNSEAQIINQLANEAGDIQVKFDDFQAIAVAKNSYVLAGQPVEASISLAAYNKAINPAVSASSGRITKVENGVATWQTTAAGVGLQTVRGSVSINLGNRTEKKDYSFSYMVGSTGASIQLDKMNVFYIGVPNPITVSAAGYSMEDISVSIPGATVNKTANGQYDVTVTTPGTLEADILAKTATGAAKVGGLKVRVKTIPDPVAKVAGKTGGFISSGVFKAQLGIPAVLDGFDFDAKFQVTSFDFSYLPKGGEYQPPMSVPGAYFRDNPTVLKYQSTQARPGDKVFIENIRAKGPDGRTRLLNAINLTLN